MLYKCPNCNIDLLLMLDAATKEFTDVRVCTKCYFSSSLLTIPYDEHYKERSSYIENRDKNKLAYSKGKRAYRK